MKKIYPIIFLLLIGLAVSISAFTLDTPATGEVMGNVTIMLSANSTALHNQTNITFYAMCTDTANSSWTTICINDTTGPVQNATCNWTPSDMEDSASCSFRATSGNDTTETDTNTGITIDRTIPVAASSVYPGEGDTLKHGTFTLTSTVTGTQTTSCTVSWEDKSPLGGSPNALVHSSNTCSYTYDNAPDGIYYYTITASDGTNTTDGSRTEFEIKTSGGGGNGAVTDSSSSSTPKALIIGIILIVGFIIYSKRK